MFSRTRPLLSNLLNCFYCRLFRTSIRVSLENTFCGKWQILSIKSAARTNQLNLFVLQLLCRIKARIQFRSQFSVISDLIDFFKIMVIHASRSWIRRDSLWQWAIHSSSIVIIITFFAWYGSSNNRSWKITYASSKESASILECQSTFLRTTFNITEYFEILRHWQQLILIWVEEWIGLESIHSNLDPHVVY